MTATPISKLPIVAPFDQQRFGVIDVVHNDAMKAEYNSRGWLGVFRRWAFPISDMGITPVVRLIGMPVYRQLLEGHGALMDLARLIPFVVYHRLPNWYEVHSHLPDWSGPSPTSWLDAASGAGAKGPCFAQSIRDVLLSIDYRNRSEPWPDAADPTAGTIGGIVIQDSHWRMDPWPAHWKPRDFAPPGGVVRWLDRQPTGVADINVWLFNCRTAHHHAAMGADLWQIPGVAV